MKLGWVTRVNGILHVIIQFGRMYHTPIIAMHMGLALYMIDTNMQLATKGTKLATAAARCGGTNMRSATVCACIL